MNQGYLISETAPTNQENRPSIGTIASTLAQYSAVYGNTLGQFSWFVGTVFPMRTSKNTYGEISQPIKEYVVVRNPLKMKPWYRVKKYVDIFYLTTATLL